MATSVADCRSTRKAWSCSFSSLSATQIPDTRKTLSCGASASLAAPCGWRIKARNTAPAFFNTSVWLSARTDLPQQAALDRNGQRIVIAAEKLFDGDRNRR